MKSDYKYLGKEATFYDGMITCSTLPRTGRLQGVLQQRPVHGGHEASCEIHPVL